MRVLLDTCVLSDLRLPRGSADVRRAVEALDSDDLFVSMVSIGEIVKGIELIKEGRNKRDVQEWLLTLERQYEDHLLPIDMETARIWGELTALAQKAGKVVPASDGLIAATARRHGLHVMTRNTVRFDPTGVLLINPWTK